jgi:hypothetical protein
LGIILVALVYFLIIRPVMSKKEPVSEIESTDIVNKIEKVLKMVTVEGHFSEIMTYSDYQYLDIPGFRKKAIIKVDGKVLVGYDLENLEINADEKTKTIRIQNMPAPRILAVDHQLRYYDIENGLFNSFTEKELSNLNAKAKELLIQKAGQTDLMKQAEAQRAEIFSLLYYMAKSSGWKIVISGKELMEDQKLN